MTKSALDTLLFELNDLEEIQKFKRLEKLIKNDENLKNKVAELHEISKQMTHAKEFGLKNAYHDYSKQYYDLMNEFEDNVLLQMYFESSEEVKNILNIITSTIEIEINNKINE